MGTILKAPNPFSSLFLHYNSRKNNPKNLKTTVKSKRIIDEKLHLKDKVFVECNLVLVY